MILWLDAHLPPSLATWMSAAFGITAVAIRTIGLRDAEDSTIFMAARAAGAIVVSKDRDFADLVVRHGPPPQVVWVTAGNSSAARLREILTATFADAIALLQEGAPLVEISDRRQR